VGRRRGRSRTDLRCHDLTMNGRDQLAVGAGALARGDWAAARDAFAASWGADETPEALDGLGRAQWWLDEPAMALDMRSRAFALFRRDHRDVAAAHVAVWLARQYRSLYRRHGMADGWLARARSLWSELEDGGSLSGWILLAESETDAPRRTDPDRAGAALAIARDRHDIDLEIVALSRRGAGKAIAGDVAAGVSDLNEAMAAATSGEGHDVQYLGEALCTLLEVSGWLGDAGLVEPWAQILVDFRASYAFGPLVPFAGTSAPELISAFCTGCCGGVYLVTGRLDAAEEQLVRGAAQLTMTGLRPRCLHPVAQLVELRILQGRLAEAEGVLTGFESDWECATAVASLDLAKGRPARAVAVLSSTLETLNDAPVLALPLQAQLVDAALAADDLALARLMARLITTTAETTGTVLHRAHGELVSCAGSSLKKSSE
jgi:hypothetical protein